MQRFGVKYYVVPQDLLGEGYEELEQAREHADADGGVVVQSVPDWTKAQEESAQV